MELAKRPLLSPEPLLFSNGGLVTNRQFCGMFGLINEGLTLVAINERLSCQIDDIT